MVVNELFKVFNSGGHVKGFVIDGGHDQIAPQMQGLAAYLFLGRLKHHFVNTALVGFSRFAKGHVHASKVVQFNHHMFQNMAAPSALTQAL